MSSMMSPARKLLLQHLADLEPPKGARADKALEVAGIPPRTALAFITALVDEGLVVSANTFTRTGQVRVLFITDAGREALGSAVLPEETVSRKADDRSAELAKLLANPAVIRANAIDVHRLLIAEAPPQEARRHLGHVEELLHILNGVARIEAGRR